MINYTPGVESIKEVDTKKRTVTGYPSTFGHVDTMHEVVDRGAFARTIEAWGPNGKGRTKALYQHDPAWLVGKPIELEEDEIGLRAVTQFADTAIARDTLKLIEDGIITEQSIGYDPIQWADDDEGVRHLREVRLYEYSFVTWGANEYTPITGIKSDNEIGQLVARMDRMERYLKGGKFDSEDIPSILELAIRQWKDALEHANLHPALPASTDPPDDTDTQSAKDSPFDDMRRWMALREFKRDLQTAAITIRE